MEPSSPLLPLAQRYVQKDPAGAARALETLPEEEVIKVLQALPPALAAKVVRQLQVPYAAEVLRAADSDLFREITLALEPHHAASIFVHLPREGREKLLEHLPKRLRLEIQDYLSFPEGSVGQLMIRNFLAFRTEVTVREAIDRIRQLAQRRSPTSYAYVVDAENRLQGVMNMRDLLLADPDQDLASIMRQDAFTLHCFTDREHAAAEMSKRRYFAVPVVDNEGHLLGVIQAENLLQEVQDEYTEDLQRMVGAGAEERVSSSVGYSLRKRLPWLHVNLATAFLAAGVVALFEDLIARITILAVFLPVVAGQGGNAGAQSLAIVMRGLVMREIPRGKVRAVIFKESILGTISGAVTGLVTGLVAWLWNGNPWMGLVISVAMIVNLFFAGFFGAALPIFMKSVGLDPAQSSSIMLTTVTDVVGFFAFLGCALLFQQYLI
ncbi:MAG: magnesium transporter [Limisphaerales bacterium]